MHVEWDIAYMLFLGLNSVLMDGFIQSFISNMHIAHLQKLITIAQYFWIIEASNLQQMGFRPKQFLCI